MRSLLLAVLLLVAIRMDAATYYVDPAGNDGNAGTSGSPWLTLQFALTQVSPGDTIFIVAGTYSGSVSASVAGTAGNPITIRGTNYSARGWGNFLVRQPYYVVEGLYLLNLQFDDLSLSNNGIVRSNYFDGGNTLLEVYGYGTWVYGNIFTNISVSSGVCGVSLDGQFNFVSNNVFTGNQGRDCTRPFGISNYITDNIFRDLITGAEAGNGDHSDIVQTFTTSIDSPGHHVFFERNFITNSHAQWANLEATTNSATGPSPSTNIHSFYFRNNVFVRSRHQINGYTPRIYVIHNTFYDSSSDYDTGVRIIGTAAKGYSHDSIVANNLWLRSYTYYQAPVSQTNSWGDYNFVTYTNDAAMSGFSETHGISGSYSPTAVMVDPANGNYNALAGADIVGAGTNLLSLVPFDYAGNSRSSTPTIGAFEFVPTSFTRSIRTGKQTSIGRVVWQ